MAPVQTSHIGPQPGGMAANGLVIGSAAVSCMLRFYTRKLSKAGLGADDWLIMVAVIIMTPMAALLARGKRNRCYSDLHLLIGIISVDTIDSDSLYATESANADYNHTAEEALYYKIGLASMVIYYSIVGATKLGILLMYFRLFNISTSFRIQLFIVSGLVLGWWIGCTIAILTCCIPLRIELLLRPGTCFNINYFWMVSGACEVMLDTMILTVPISVVARMNLSLKRKCMVSGIFLLGGLYVSAKV